MAANSFVEVGETFVKFYYTQFSGDRSILQGIYTAESMFTWEDKKIQGVENIMVKLKEIPGTVKFKILTTDSQPTVNGGVLLLVMGDTNIDDGPPMRFAHSFHLQRNVQGTFFVLNEIFRLSLG